MKKTLLRFREEADHVRTKFFACILLFISCTVSAQNTRHPTDPVPKKVVTPSGTGRSTSTTRTANQNAKNSIHHSKFESFDGGNASSGYFALTLAGKEYDYASAATSVTVTAPVTLNDSAFTFKGNGTIPYERMSVVTRTMLGAELSSMSPFAFYTQLSFSSAEDAFRRYRSIDYFEFGIRYNVGYMPAWTRENSIDVNKKKQLPHWVFSPGIGLIFRTKKYYTGTIQNPGKLPMTFAGQSNNGDDHDMDDPPMGTANVYFTTVDRILRLDISTWYRPTHTISFRNPKPWLSYRLDLGYDLQLDGSDKLMGYVKHNNVQTFELYKHQAVKYYQLEGTGRMHSYGGPSVTLTLVYTL